MQYVNKYPHSYGKADAWCVSVFVSCLVFRKPSIFMIQLLHKPQIWFSVSLAEQPREREKEEEERTKKKGESEIQTDLG